MFMAFNYKQYGFLSLNDDRMLTIIGSCGSILNGMGRLVWGIALDKFSFRTISIIFNLTFLAAAISVSFVSNNYIYLLYVSIIYFCYGGTYSVYAAQTIKIMGKQLGSKIYFIVFTGFTLGKYDFKKVVYFSTFVGIIQ